MTIRKNILRGILLLFALQQIVIIGCVPEMALDLSEEVDETVFKDMYHDETTFLKSILISGNTNTKGSVAWMEEVFQTDIKKGDYVLTSNLCLVTFFYPSHIKNGYSSRMIFSNVERVQNADSTDYYSEWINVARLIEEKVQFPEVECRFIAWFVTKSKDHETEKLFEVKERFRLKNGKWELLEVHKNFRK